MPDSHLNNSNPEKIYSLLNLSEKVGQVGSWEFIVAPSKIHVSGIAREILNISSPKDSGLILQNLKCSHSKKSISDIIISGTSSGATFTQFIELNFGEHTKFIRINGECESNSEKKVVRSFGNIQDLTYEFEKERTLKESEISLKDAQHLSKIGSWTWYPQENRVKWSEEMFRILGLEPSKDEITIDTVFKFIHPDDIQHVRDITNKALFEKRAIPVEYRVITPNGTIKHVRGSGEAVIRDGEMIKMFGTIQDISSEVVLKNQLKAYWKNSQDLLCIFDLKGNIKSINPKWSRLLGYSISESKTLSFEEILHPNDRQMIFRKICLLIQTPTNSEFTCRVKTKNNNHIWVSWLCSSNMDSKEVYASGRDITYMVESEEKLKNSALELEAKNKALEQFAYIASHDLKEPLRTITSLTDLWIKDNEHLLDENGRTVFDFVKKATKRMDSLISGLLDYSMIGSNENIELLNTKAIVTSVLEDLSLLVEEKQATITIEQLPEIRGYKTGVRQVFQNLVGNALKYTKKNGEKPKINISCNARGKEYIFCIQDNGIGISTEDKEKIFKIFQRLHNRSEYEGSGIGLAHCQKITEVHGGRIWVESTVGQGSSFYFSFGEQEIQHSASTENQSKRNKSGGHLSIAS
ncbi:PAS domain-containing sensor histidine kinase [Luteibaculum oceani]|uniref:histidine kinase n=1 Tax=Luteibaculum oceani TaxID=1294296 RepID=A0A5C6UTF0_9FLAO|nr:ATP-binding protein [Luteibaculum oceani]TXC76249.1 PAS domain S-box protein [Luteibaculum oceani]